MGHLRTNGFEVKDEATQDMTAVKRRLRVPEKASSCHTGVVDGYVVEGHVPADVIDRLLAERPRVVGIAVPGMPIGSPGMEVPGRPAQPYEILSFDALGETRVFAKK